METIVAKKTLLVIFLFLFGSYCLKAQTIMSGDYIITGNLQVGNSLDMTSTAENYFYGSYLNSAINFYRGSGSTGGWITIHVHDGRAMAKIDYKRSKAIH